MAKSAAILRKNSKKALMLAQSGRYEESIKAYLQVIRSSPGDSHAAFMLGALYGNLEQFAESAKFSRLATNLDAGNSDAYYNLAQAEKHLGNTDAAVSALREVVKLAPDHLDAYNNLGYALTEQGKFDEAILQYKRMLEIQHNHVDALCSLASVYQITGDLSKSRRLLKIALIHEPESVDVNFKLAGIAQIQGDVDVALSIYNKLLKQDPDNPLYTAAKAMLFEKTGQFDEGLELITPFLDSGKYYPNIARAFAKLARHFNKTEEAIQHIESTLEKSAELKQYDDMSPSTTGTYESSLSFELGRLYDALGKYDDAFRYYQRSHSSDYHKSPNRRLEKSFVKLQEFYTREFFASAPTSSIVTSKPIFIVGMPRSGTTLTEQILSSHPEVAGGGELNDIFNISNHIPTLLNSRHPYPECMKEINTETLDICARKYLDKLDEISSSALHVTDKMPHNFVQIGLIRLLFPDARIIHCVRNPLDNCLSIFFSQFNQAHAYAANLRTLGEHYSGYTRLMAHWNELFADSILEHRYEDVIDDQEGMTKRLLDFCNLDWDPACMKFFKSKRVVNTISYDQVRQPIYKKSVARWRNYEKHLGPLIESLGIDPESLRESA